MTAKILLADFQFLTRQGITSLIDTIPDFQIVHQMDQPQGLEAAINQFQPDIAVVSVTDQEDQLVSDVIRLKKNSKIKFFILPDIENTKTIRQLLDTGIKWIITKNSSKEEITNALKAVIKDERFLSSQILDIMFNNQEGSEPIDLSPREYEVLQLIAKGNTSSKIAKELFLSVHTINSHRKSILKKLNMKSPAELIMYAIKNGIVETN